MFQYAAGKSIALAHSQDLMLDTGAFGISSGINRTDRNLDILDFNLEVIPESQSKTIQHRLPFGVLSRAKSYLEKKIFNKYYYGWHPELYDRLDLNYLDGYFQSKEYSERILECIKRSFTLKSELNEEISDFRKIFVDNKFIAVHIRRGDYFSDLKIARWHGICDRDYYQKGLYFLRNAFPEYRIAIFSDDLIWAKKNIIGIEDAFSINEFAKNSGIILRASQELILMSLCKHFLISNSTYSWWAQYLCSDDNSIVVAPSTWNRNPRAKSIDLISPEWRIIDVS